MPPAATTGTLTGIDHLRHEREGAGLRGDISGQEHAAMAAGFGALRNDNVGAVVFEPARFLHRRRRTDDDAAGIFDALQQRRFRQTEMKARGFRLHGFDDLAHRRVERRAIGRRHWRVGIETEFLVERCEAFPPCRIARASAGTGVWQKKFRLNGRSVRWRMMPACSRALSADSMAQGKEPSAPPSQAPITSSAS